MDIVALEGDCIVFIEVRSRRGTAYGTPEESIVPAKARRLILLAQAYRKDRKDLALPLQERIDLVAVDLGPHGSSPIIRLLRNAVEGE